MKIICKEFGITMEAYKKFSYDYLQCEGYGDNGTEYETLNEYIQMRLQPKRPAWLNNPEPMYKGDYIND